MSKSAGSLQTERLLLRPFTEADFEAYSAIVADAEAMRFIHHGALTRAAAWWNFARYVGHWQMRGFGMWAAIERQSGRMVGYIGLLQPDLTEPLEVGWALARAEWGQGYALEGCRAVLAHAFEQLGAPEVKMTIVAGNDASMKLAAKLGAAQVSQREEAGRMVTVWALRQPSREANGSAELSR